MRRSHYVAREHRQRHHPRHASCDGAALGQASHTDFLIFAREVQEPGRRCLPQCRFGRHRPRGLFGKPCRWLRNVARQKHQEIRNFTTAVFDLVNLPGGYRSGPPTKEHAMYYYRPWKTILVRTVTDGGTSFYFSGDHRKPSRRSGRRRRQSGRNGKKDAPLPLAASMLRSPKRFRRR